MQWSVFYSLHHAMDIWIYWIFLSEGLFCLVFFPLYGFLSSWIGFLAQKEGVWHNVLI